MSAGRGLWASLASCGCRGAPVSNTTPGCTGWPLTRTRYKGYGATVIDKNGTPDRNEFYNVSRPARPSTPTRPR